MCEGDVDVVVITEEADTEAEAETEAVDDTEPSKDGESNIDPTERR